MGRDRGGEGRPRALPEAPVSGGPPAGAARRDAALLAGLALLALAVRLPRLGGDLWIDEIATLVAFVRIPLREIATTYVSANQHVLYSLLAHVSCALLGESAVALRLPALLFGVATVPAIAYLARTIGTRAEGTAAALILAVSYHHAYFSQSARGYTGLLLFSVLSTAFLLRALATGSRRHWAGFVLASVANLYVHLNGAFLLAAQAAGALALHVLPAPPAARGAAFRPLAAALAAVVLGAGALYAPIVASMVTFFATADRDVGWAPSWSLLRVIARDTAPGPAALAAALAALPVGIAGLASVARSAPLVVVVMFLPVVLGLGAVLAMGVGTYPRFFLGLLPFAIVVGVRGLRVVSEAVGRARGLRARGPRAARAFALLAALAALAAASGLPRLYALPKQDYTGALAYVRERRAPGDLVAAAYVTDTGARFYDPSVLSARSAEDLEAVLARADADRAAVWLLATFVLDMRARDPRLAGLVDARFREVARFRGLVGDGDVLVYRSEGTAAGTPEGEGSVRAAAGATGS